MSFWVTIMGMETEGFSLVSNTGHGGVWNTMVFESTNAMLRVDLGSIDGWPKRTVNAKKQWNK